MTSVESLNKVFIALLEAKILCDRIDDTTVLDYYANQPQPDKVFVSGLLSYMRDFCATLLDTEQELDKVSTAKADPPQP